MQKKYRVIDGDMWFFSGPTFDFDVLVGAYKSKEKVGGGARYTVGAIRVSKGVAYLLGIDEGIAWESVIENSDSLGSGGLFALASLDHGKTVRQAVEYACTRDIYSGGKIRVYDIATAKFIEEG